MQFQAKAALLMLAIAGVSAASHAAPPEQSESVAVSELRPKPGKGLVIFYRIGRHADGYGSSCPILDGNVSISKIQKNSYLAVDTEPGLHRYSVKVETTDDLTLEVEPGETYYVQCVMTHGILRPRPDIRPSTREEFLTFPKLKPMREPSAAN